jgi:crossover junction endodeoxyribonuclease RuvC
MKIIRHRPTVREVFGTLQVPPRPTTAPNGQSLIIVDDPQRDVWIGIDPGVSGACVALSRGRDFLVHQCRGDDTLTDRLEFLKKMRLVGHCYAIIEEVHSMPKQGVKSTFTFGRNVGQWDGLLTAAAIPYRFVTPLTWMKLLRCQSHGDKNITKAAAQRLFPSQTITHRNADAFLIAEYCHMTQGGSSV